jgi:HPt (histidine-containing phosphotransfer) domain-containing protein
MTAPLCWIDRLAPAIWRDVVGMPDERDKPIPATPLPIDLSAIEDLADGDPAVEAELIAMFARHTVEAIAKLRAAIGADQLAEAAAIAHTCIGFTSTIGIAMLVPTLRELEQAAKTAQREELARLLAQWEREFGDVRRTLAARLNRTAP